MKAKLIDSVALVVVDMQDAFLRAIPDGEALLWRCCFAVEAAQLLGVRTFFTTQVPEKLGEVNPRLLSLQQTAPVFPKTAFSALRAPGLQERLEKDQIDHLILAGIEVPICVYQTAIDAANDEVAVTLLSDCIGGRRSEDRQPVLSALAQTGCHLLPSEAVFYSILGEADHPAFKPFTALVKKYSGKAFSES
jgi:nicotinamidase-related amidase